MTIPTYDKLLLPLLQVASDGKEHHIREAISLIAKHLKLTDEERNERIGSGKLKLDDRVQWANTYLKKAGLLESVGRGLFCITQRGIAALDESPQKIDLTFLNRYPEFAEFRSRSQISTTHKPSNEERLSTQTPEEALEANFRALREKLVQDLLENVIALPPSFLEELVVELLQKMGYGKRVDNSGTITGSPGDGGIDGVITEDKLGFDAIYLQAKSWKLERKVDGETVRSFAGSLIHRGATKGVFITTSSFTPDAVRYSETVKQLKIVLIDGRHLAEHMIDHEIGITVGRKYVIMDIDKTYFERD